MRHEEIYIKTDRNGTKYYADYTCERCGGAGGHEKWNYTGWTCYQCGGTGKLASPRIIKRYTPEYQAKLDARRAKREAERFAKRKEEFANDIMKLIEKQGFNPEGKIFVVTGNTFEIKDELKEAGAKYRDGLGWYFLNDSENYETIELDYTECLDIDAEYFFTISWKSYNELKALVAKKQPQKSSGEYVGEIGERITRVVKFLSRYQFERPAFRGWGTEIIDICNFEDGDGNFLVWKTGGYINAKLGSMLKITGTVKEHEMYKGDKQTVLQRVKWEVVE